MKIFFSTNKNNIWFWLFIVGIVVLFFALPLLSLDAGNTGDEDAFQIPQGRNVIEWFKTNGEDSTALTFKDLKYYGSSFDVITEAFNRIFNIDDINTSRHIFNSLLGWIAILFSALIAIKIGGWRAGVLTMLFLFLSPRFLGHSFNNPKDIPFATAVVVALYFMVVFFETFPKVKWHTVLLLILSIAFSISIRIGGLILFGFFGLFAFVYLIKRTLEHKAELQKNLKKNQKMKFLDYFSAKEFGRLLIYGMIIFVLSYFLGLLLWPYALLSPIKNPIEAFTLMSHFNVSIRQLFEGTLQWSDALPWYYTPKYILMTVPVAVIIGLLIYPFIGGGKKENRFNTFIVYFACIFPIFWIVFTNANVYGGWRHAMFAYPPMVVGAGLGFNALINLFANKYLKIVGTALPFLLLILPLSHIIRNHPYEYVYFNKLAGGMNNAYGNYEMDYYYHSSREATEWVIANAEKSGLETGDKISVASWHASSVGYFLRNDTARFQNTFSRWLERGNNDWDYAIFVITGMMPEQIRGEHFPPKNSVHEITVDGKPICFILKREDKSDLIGNNFKKANQTDSAIYYLEKSFAYDDYNETVIQNLIELYFMTGRMDDAKKMLDHGLLYLPKSETMNYFLAHYYMVNNRLDEAINVGEKILDINYKFSAGYHILVNCYLRKNDAKAAEKTLLRMIDVDMLDEQGMKQLMEIYKAQGMTEGMAAKRVYTAMAKSFEKRGKKEEAEIYRGYAKGIK